jgi:hypothetical protein
MQLSDTYWSCIYCKNKGTGSKRWSNGKLTVFLRGILSSGLFQHDHVTSNRKLVTPAGCSTDRQYVHSQQTALVHRETVPPMRHRYGRFVYQKLSSVTGSIQLLMQTVKLAMIPDIHLFCGTFKTRNLKYYLLQVRRRPFICPCL